MRYMKFAALALAGTSLIAIPVAAMAQAASSDQTVPAAGQEASQGEGRSSCSARASRASRARAPRR